ncbi:hypothetical protein HDU76_005078 [Blyttiomyces sp. JEL0837]|nr:hypothetical protein HDU76_005078 [Blyttiomyces sp. JEL0837]
MISSPPRQAGQQYLSMNQSFTPAVPLPKSDPTGHVNANPDSPQQQQQHPSP